MSVDVVNNNEEVSVEIRNIVEAALYAADNPLSIDQILALFPEDERPEKADIKSLLKAMEAEYENRGIELKQVSSGYRFQVKQAYSPWVSRLWEEKPPRYTKALLETLALIAYRQPITRAEIEDVRGVAVSSNIIKTLQERNWVKVVGHRDVPGRPALFATTKEFLDYFNLKSMDELPTLAEIKSLDDVKTSSDSEITSEFSEEEIKEVEEHVAAVEAESGTEIDADLESDIDDDDFDEDDMDEIEAMEASDADDDDEDDEYLVEASDDGDLDAVEEVAEETQALSSQDDIHEDDAVQDEDVVSFDGADVQLIDADKTDVVENSDQHRHVDAEESNDEQQIGSSIDSLEDSPEDSLDTVTRTAAAESIPEGTLLN